uniref:Uncharacterized protein n=1 Tax=Timema shepardi TaxID=629360 RepID=A0A7R9AWJ5_TIMSH|nr:unnamed protein product [Timema shepardi]
MAATFSSTKLILVCLVAMVTLSWAVGKTLGQPGEKERLLNELDAITISCDASMPRLKNQGSHRLVYWWTPEIAALRKRCLELRRRATRVANLALDHASYSSEYKKAKKELNNTIKASKMTLWKEICNDIEQDIWGKAYQIVV